MKYSEARSYDAFRQEAVENASAGGENLKMFLMIADECHWGVGAGGSVDKIVNDLGNHGELLYQENFFRLLVSATPAAVLTDASMLDTKYYKHGPADVDVIEPLRSAVNRLSIYAHLDEVDADNQVHAVALPLQCIMLHVFMQY